MLPLSTMTFYQICKWTTTLLICLYQVNSCDSNYLAMIMFKSIENDLNFCQSDLFFISRRVTLWVFPTLLNFYLLDYLDINFASTHMMFCIFTKQSYWMKDNIAQYHGKCMIWVTHRYVNNLKKIVMAFTVTTFFNCSHYAVLWPVWVLQFWSRTTWTTVSATVSSHTSRNSKTRLIASLW